MALVHVRGRWGPPVSGAAYAMTRMQRPLLGPSDRSHRRAVPSAAAVTQKRPRRSMATACSGPAVSGRRAKNCSGAARRAPTNNCMEPRSLRVVQGTRPQKRGAAGGKGRPPACPRMMEMHVPLSSSQRRAVASVEAVTSTRPSAETAISVTVPVCPSSSSTQSPISMSYTRAVPSADAEQHTRAHTCQQTHHALQASHSFKACPDLSNSNRFHRRRALGPMRAGGPALHWVGPGWHCQGTTCDDIDAARCQQDLGQAGGVAAQDHALPPAGLVQRGALRRQRRAHHARRLLERDDLLLVAHPLLHHSARAIGEMRMAFMAAK
jgi:hypothetical protein